MNLNEFMHNYEAKIAQNANNSFKRQNDQNDQKCTNDQKLEVCSYNVLGTVLWPK
jgi:hypothetical protein